MPNGRVRGLMRHPVSVVGGALAFFSFFSILSMFLIEAILGKANPYIGVFTYMVYPGLLIFGLVLIPIGALLERRRRVRKGELPPYPRIDLNNPRARAVLFLVVFSSLILMGLISTVSYRAYHFTDSVAFCGELCRSVMEPEYTAYQESPHARVTCAECHVGPGAGWFVRSKLSGAYQIYSVLFKKYPRPVPTPVENLRPAQETCEQCHWPEKFFGAQLKVITRFSHDEDNSARQVRTLIRTGGGSPTTGITAGIHWHMNIANEIWYGAADPKRQKIPWVRMKDSQGRVSEYFDRTVSLTPEQIAKLEIRRMDCMDCHNRPSHIFRDPDSAVDLALLAGRIDRSLPYIKREAVRVLSQSYSSKEKAREGIATGLDSFYVTRYPKLYPRKREAIKKVVAEVQRIYQTNMFPEMNVDWRTHPDNIGHTLYPGCFRCHEGNHVSRDGKTIRRDCQLCHTIIGQETKVPSPTEVAVVEKFNHPWPLRGKHLELSCNQCHWRGRGLIGECTTCHARPADAPMAFPCAQCHQKEQSVKPVTACVACHPSRTELHLKPTHAAAECTGCHVPHEWKAARREVCVTCHQDKVAHNPQGICRDCHAFRQVAKAG
ncbi:MAG: NapC/NirT family cytochrome c [Deltaproteobacteria bacterium]|nr:NapC/NirT family cytochrome c [Deltaproteobacteria bacterium]